MSGRGESLGTRSAKLFDRQPRDGRADHFAARADDLDPVIVAELPPDGGPSQVGLPLHEARRRICKLGRQAHDRRRIVARTVPEIGVTATEQISTRAVSMVSSVVRDQSGRGAAARGAASLDSGAAIDVAVTPGLRPDRVCCSCRAS